MTTKISRRKTGKEFYKWKHLTPASKSGTPIYCFLMFYNKKYTKQLMKYCLKQKNLTQNLIKSPSVIFCLQKIQKTKKHVKWHHENNDHQIQNVENSTRLMTPSTNKRCRGKRRGKVNYKFKIKRKKTVNKKRLKRHLPNEMCGPYWDMTQTNQP